MASFMTTSTSVRTFYLLLLSVYVAYAYHVVQTITGEVKGEEFKHFKYNQHRGDPLTAALFSDIGDADIYVAVDRIPTVVDYDYSSDSCGEDLVVLLSSKKERILNIGINGHLRYPNTSFRLYIIKPDLADMARYSIVDESYITSEGSAKKKDKLSITEFMDSLAISNDPALVELVNELRELASHRSLDGGKPAEDDDFGTLVGTVLVKILEFVVEVLL